MMKQSYIMHGIVVAIFIIAADQLCKFWLLEIIDIDSKEPLEITSFFRLVMVWNKGVSFGMLADYNIPLLLTVLSLLITAILLYWLAKANSIMLAIAIGTIIGGAIGNIIDRLRFGAVADFFDFHLASYHWPAFNIADSAIFIGVVVLIANSIMTKNLENGNNDGQA